MVFVHDTEVALAVSAALVNTDRPHVDLLGDTGALERFVQQWGFTGSRRGDEAELESVRALRPRLRRLWVLEVDELAVEVNAILREARALPQLVRHDAWPYHLHADAPGAGLAERMAVEAGMAFVDLVRQCELARLRVCAAGGCTDVFVDLSKNQSRRYCGSSCANRVNVAAYRARAQRPGGENGGGPEVGARRG